MLVRAGLFVAVTVLCVAVSACSDDDLGGSSSASTFSPPITAPTLPSEVQAEADRATARCETEVAERAPGAQLTGSGSTLGFIEPFDSPLLDGPGVLCVLTMPSGPWAWIALADNGSVVTFVESGGPVQYCPPLEGSVPTDAAGVPIVGPTC